METKFLGSTWFFSEQFLKLRSQKGFAAFPLSSKECGTEFVPSIGILYGRVETA